MGSFDGMRALDREVSLFDRALQFYLINEGGDVDHAGDPGGVTSRGIATAYNPELGNVTELTDEQVRAHYRKKYWRKIFEMLDSDPIAIKMFDIATNAGFDDASLVMQRAILSCGGEVVVDGVMGSRTVREANMLSRSGLLNAICIEQWKMYQQKMKEMPEKAAFSNGWMARANRVPGEV